MSTYDEALDYLVSMALGHDYADGHKIQNARDVIEDAADDIARQAVNEALEPVRALADEWEREFANFRLDQPIHLALHAALAAAEGVDR